MFRDPDPTKLTPGVIDEFAKRAFKFGGCGALALAIHEATGWPLVAITDAHNVEDGKALGGSALHYSVRRPDGLLIDIDGAFSDEQMIWAYGGDADDGEAAVGDTTIADINEWYVECQGAPIPISLAKTFVSAVLASTGSTPVK